MTEVKDARAWKRKATAFATRAHRHLWGKNNEDPLVFLYRNGLRNEFCKSIYLGWNKFSQERPCNTWGIAGQAKFILPAGIVFPHIVDRNLMSVFIISMDESVPTAVVPGSRALPGKDLFLGEAQGDTITAGDLMKGLHLLQENTGGIRIRIPLSEISLMGP